MYSRTRLAALTGAVLLAAGVLSTNIAAADEPPPAVVYCAGLPATIVVAAPGMVTYGDPGGVPTNDVIVGTNGPDDIRGLDGNDVICGLDGNDWLFGGDGNDRVFGQEGDDVMLGGDGMDVLNGGPHLNGDSGNGGAQADACPATEILFSC